MVLFPKCLLAIAFASAAGHAAGTRASLPKGVISIPLARIKNQTAYGVQFAVGTPPQITTLEMDTGSPTIGFESPRSNECKQPNEPCALYGSYDNTTSTTSVYVGGGYYDELVNQGRGSYVNDTLTFGGHTFKSMMFGVLDEVDANFYLTAPDSGIFGLGQLCFSGNNCTDYPTLIQQLYNRHVLSTRAFSVYLGPEEPQAKGNLLFGGIDRAKQGGPVIKLPMIPPDSNDANHTPNWVNYTSVAFTSASGNTTVSDVPPESYSLLDTGNPIWYLPLDLWSPVSAYLDISPSLPSEYPPFTVDCALRRPTNASISVGFNGNATIHVPMNRLVTQLNEDTCVTYVGGTDGLAFGDPFIRSIYITYDVDSLTISLSQVKYTDDEHIVAI